MSKAFWQPSSLADVRLFRLETVTRCQLGLHAPAEIEEGIQQRDKLGGERQLAVRRLPSGGEQEQEPLADRDLEQGGVPAIKLGENLRPLELGWIEVYARPEFNSPTAYFRTPLDLGYFGSLLYYVVQGYVIGLAYAGFRRGHRFGLLAYGVCVLYLMESLRYAYISESRFVPLLLGLLILAFDMRRQQHLLIVSAWAGSPQSQVR